MKKIVYTFLITTISLVSCTRDFEKMNTDTDNVTPNAISVEILLPNVLIQLADIQVGANFTLGNVVSQHITNLLYNNVDRYLWQADDRYWNFYKQLQNINDIEALGIKNNQPQQQGVALVLKALIFTQLSDAYGSVPFLQAGKANEGILKPNYDSQEEIYRKANEMLIQANNLLSKPGKIGGDTLFGNNAGNWRKFANSLRLRILAKMINKVDKKSEINTIFSNPSEYPIFTSNSDHAVYTYAGSGNQVSPYTAGRGRTYEFEQITALPKPLESALLKNNDPRIDVWFDKPNKDKNNSHNGSVPGSTSSDFKSYSMLALSFHTDLTKLKGIFITYSEIQFLLAEAAEKGWIASDPKMHYENAVKASFDFWKVSMPIDFLASKAKYTFPNAELIAEQKWIAFFGNGFEAWNDYKRTGLPKLLPSKDNANSNKIPVRLLYPSIEQSINGENYKSATTQIGGDNINSKLWWHK